MAAIAAPPLPRHRFTLGDYEQMITTGVLGPDDRVELLDGEIIEMAPIGPVHADVVDRLNRLLVPAIDDRATVRVQNPLRLPPRSQPEPDLALVRRRSAGYRAAHPDASDVFLVVEVADSSLPVDRDVKLALYAGEEIGEVWIVDVSHREVLVHRTPRPHGYEESFTARPGDPITVTAFPDVQLNVTDILGPDEMS